jgi:ABC-type molybdate transport system substrate-binding protein
MSDVFTPASLPEPTPASKAPAPKSRKRLALAAGGVVLVAAVAGGGAWAYQAWTQQGDQPANALPASTTLGYAAIDLDPTGQQKIEAVQMLNKFPAFKDKLDLGTKDDLRKKVFEAIQDGGQCKELDFKKDVDGWLGDRYAVAAIDQGTGKTPAPVVVLQVKDAGKAETGLKKLSSCLSEGSSDGSGYAVRGDWAILAETEDIATGVAKDAEKAPLADDDDFKKWTDAAGDPGIVSLYAAPKAAKVFYDQVVAATSANEVPASAKAFVENFKGAGGSIRVSDGAVEAEFATEKPKESLVGKLSDKGTEAASSLPETTAAAIGLALPSGWVQRALDANSDLIKQSSGMSVDDLVKMVEDQSGLSVPEDIETLTGESLALAVDSDFDANSLMQGDTSSVPVGLKIKGDTKAIEKVLDKLRATGAKSGMPADFVVSKTAGDYVVVTLSKDYADKLASEKGLGGTSLFEKVVPKDKDATGVFFINFDAGKHWLDQLLKDLEVGSEVIDNVKPLQGIGASAWLDGNEAHSLLSVTTE